jgi:hypothetical protein
MPASGTDPLDVLFFIIAIMIGAVLLIVLGGGIFQSWRRWADNRRIRKHLRQ